MPHFVDELEQALIRNPHERGPSLADRFPDLVAACDASKGAVKGDKWIVVSMKHATTFGHVVSVSERHTGVIRTMLIFDAYQIGVPEAFVAFRQGIDSLVALQSNDCVPKVEDRDEHNLWVVIDTVDYELLRSGIANWNFGVKKSVLKQLFKAVDAFHEKGFVIRGLSPHSIAVVGGSRPRPFVLDWALATRRNPAVPTLQAARFASGTYAAPEQRAAVSTEPAADMYSIGRLVEAAVTEDPDLTNAQRLLVEHCSFSSKIPKAVAIATHPEAAKRFHSAAEFLAALHGRRPRGEPGAPRRLPSLIWLSEDWVWRLVLTILVVVLAIVAKMAGVEIPKVGQLLP